MLKGACTLAIKKLKHWMMPEKVLFFRSCPLNEAYMYDIFMKLYYSSFN